MRQRKFLYFVDGDDGLAYVPERASLEEYLDYVFAGMEGAGVDLSLIHIFAPYFLPETGKENKTSYKK